MSAYAGSLEAGLTYGVCAALQNMLLLATSGGTRVHGFHIKGLHQHVWIDLLRKLRWLHPDMHDCRAHARLQLLHKWNSERLRPVKHCLVFFKSQASTLSCCWSLKLLDASLTSHLTAVCRRA